MLNFQMIIAWLWYDGLEKPLKTKNDSVNYNYRTDHKNVLIAERAKNQYGIVKKH